MGCGASAPAAAAAAAAPSARAAPAPRAAALPDGALGVCVVRGARGLPRGADLLSRADPYCAVRALQPGTSDGWVHFSSKAVPNDQSPTWDLCFYFGADWPAVRVTVVDDDDFTSDDVLGSVEVDLAALAAEAGGGAVARALAPAGAGEVLVEAATGEAARELLAALAAGGVRVAQPLLPGVDALEGTYGPLGQMQVWAGWLGDKYKQLTCLLESMVLALKGSPAHGDALWLWARSRDGGRTATTNDGTRNEVTHTLRWEDCAALLRSSGERLASGELFRRNWLGSVQQNSSMWPEVPGKCVALGADASAHAVYRPLMEDALDAAAGAWTPQSVAAAAARALPAEKRQLYPMDVDEYVQTLLHKVHFGIDLGRDECEDFREWQTAVTVNGVVPEPLMGNFVVRMALGTDKALAKRERWIARYSSALEAKFGERFAGLSETQRAQVASAFADSVLLAGGLAVSNLIKQTLLMLYSGEGLSMLPHGFMLSADNVEIFCLEMVRFCPQVSGSQLFERETNRHLSAEVSAAAFDPEVWGDPKSFRLRPREDYARLSLAFAEAARCPYARQHSRHCPGKELALATFTAFMKRFVEVSGKAFASNPCAAWAANKPPHELPFKRLRGVCTRKVFWLERVDPEHAASVPYSVSVRVAKQVGAATDAAVRLRLIGERGSTRVELNKDGNGGLWPLLTGADDGTMRDKGGAATAHFEGVGELGELGACVLTLDDDADSVSALEKALAGALPDLTELPISRNLDIMTDLHDALGVSTVELMCPGRHWRFPLHTWLTAKEGRREAAVGFCGRGALPSATPSHLAAARALDLSLSRGGIKLESMKGGAIPAAAVLPLPISESFNDGKAVNFAKGVLGLVLGSLKLKLAPGVNEDGAFLSVAEFQSVHKMLNIDVDGMPGPFDDVTFGAIFLAGPLAGYMTRISADKNGSTALLPERLAGAVSDAVLADHPHAPAGATLAGEAAAGRLFWTSSEALTGCALPESELGRFDGPRYCTPEAAVLLLSRPDLSPPALLPLAISLAESEGAPLFTPADSVWDWRTAKAHVLCNLALVHQVGLHWTDCHAAAEPMCAAVNSRLSHLHPLRRLLMPHVNYTLAINATARKTLIQPTGLIETLFAAGPNGVCFDDACAAAWAEKLGEEVSPTGVSFAASYWARWEGYANLPRMLEQRGLGDDGGSLPVFPFRDDAMPLWEAIDEWVGEYLSVWYADDADCVADVELAAFVKELLSGFGSACPVRLREGYARAATSMAALRDLLSSFIFQVSVVHAARNYTQLRWYGCLGLAPFNMRTEPPTDKGNCTERSFCQMMPSPAHCLEGVAAVRLLSMYAETDQYLGAPDRDWVACPEAEAAHARYRQRLRAAAEAARARRSGRAASDPYAYDVLGGVHRVPTSVAI